MKLVSFEFEGRQQAGLVDSIDIIALHSSLKEILARGGIDAQPDQGLEPLAVRVDQAHQRDRHLAQLRGQPGQVIEGTLQLGVKDVITPERFDPEPKSSFWISAPLARSRT